ncbi:hypothetical protein SAMN06295888_12262 [Desulfonatronum zhilinae]|nr:hypothetical protein SAMN06295888_12262 [Desulfonatronum zhilinae]
MIAKAESRECVPATHDDLLTARVNPARAWIRLYRSLGDGWSATPSPTEQWAFQL